MELNILKYDDFIGLQEGVKGKEFVKPIDFIYSLKPFDQVPIIINDKKHGWVGKERRLHIKGKISVMTQLHEAFHYFMCKPSRLKYDDFGLGIGSESFGLDNIKMQMGFAESLKEENAVCVLTICAAVQLGIPKNAIVQEMNYANLGGTSIKEYNEWFDLIKKRKLAKFGFQLKYP